MSIVQNKKAFHDYFIEDKFEAGIVLEGWEVKAIRDNRAQLKEAYVIIQRGEIYLLGCHISPLGSTSTHVSPDNVRTRKLLLKGEQIVKLIGKVERAGYTLVPLDLHFKNGLIKCEIGLAKGKKQYDKRAVEKEKDWKREQSRILRAASKGK
ncbi:MAG: SsrA-binding protein SmpB [Methylophilaceae bacterium]|nr:SsrA-binding protein SmpB [Methylophilaceae bacterium]MBL6726816.1 SsrA-binding protein SmpB [Methylophilaceae bacterium]MBL6791275.1 SsrA-binding protein SmpB [Methylophilaceae bacterium]